MRLEQIRKILREIPKNTNLALQRVARGHHHAQLVEVGGHFDAAAPLDLAVVLARLLLLFLVDLGRGVVVLEGQGKGGARLRLGHHTRRRRRRAQHGRVKAHAVRAEAVHAGRGWMVVLGHHCRIADTGMLVLLLLLLLLWY